MSVESDFRQSLIAIPEVSALVSERIYPVVAPQNSSLPFMTYRRVAGGFVQYTHDGESRAQKATFQVSAVSETFDGAIELARSVRIGLSTKGIFFKEPEDNWNQETGLFVRTQECTVSYQKGE